TVVPDFDAQNNTTSREGVQGMLVSDTSTATESATRSVGVIQNGTASLDFKPVHSDSYLRIVFRDASAYIIHFVLKDGEFYYFDHTNTETATGVSYTAGSWYNLSVNFNGDKKTYDLTVTRAN